MIIGKKRCSLSRGIFSGKIKKVYQSHIKQRKKVVLIFQRLVMKMKDLLQRWSVNQGGINSCVDSHCDLADICTNSRMGVKTSKYFSGGL